MIARLLWLLAVGIGLVSYANAVALTRARPGRRYLTRATGARAILGAVEFLLVAAACALSVSRRDLRLVETSAPSPTITILGLAGALISIGGAALAAWAKARLGRLFTAHLGVKEDHTLVTDGPYAVVRHPIYLGVILFSLGTAGVWNSVACVGLAAGLGICFAVQLRIEERIFAAHFGAAYEDYRRRVPALLPTFRRTTAPSPPRR
jgi:protein-S-isoprenylcysteine O-methyltransferase Ste14